MTLVITTDVESADESLPLLERDDYLYGAKGAAHVFDLSNRWCFPRQGPPINGDVVHDLAIDGADGRITMTSGAVIGFDGKGLDFHGVNASPNGVVMPGNPLASLGSNQNFLLCAYVKVPTLAEWLEGNGPMHIFVGDAAFQAQATEEQLLQMAFVATTAGPQIWIRRQTAAGQNFAQISFSPAEVPHGEVAQIAAWRTADGFFGRIRSASKNVPKGVARGANNTAVLSDNQILFGRASISSSTAKTTSHTIYRGMFENLDVSQRDAAAVLDEDYARNVAGSAFR
ncbi:hypothetical protein [Stenotrophomonas sp.]|uniref:hypothetical protein n=1 Tax=Stenotrophomonas sp. TaxID=69392 RepID=UPI0028AD3527|nr:hypothetical protein [Stenotrophomonas sp.]